MDLLKPPSQISAGAEQIPVQCCESSGPAPSLDQRELSTRNRDPAHECKSHVEPV